MSTDVVAILVTSALQTSMQSTAIFMLYQQGRMLTDINKMVAGANQVALATMRLDELIKEVRDLLSTRHLN